MYICITDFLLQFENVWYMLFVNRCQILESHREVFDNLTRGSLQLAGLPTLVSAENWLQARTWSIDPSPVTDHSATPVSISKNCQLVKLFRNSFWKYAGDRL